MRTHNPEAQVFSEPNSVFFFLIIQNIFL